MTFGELDRAANAMAHAFAPHATEPGDRVAVMTGNSTDAFAVWHGATRLGALVVPVSTRLTEAEVAYIVAGLRRRAGRPRRVGRGRRAAARAGVPALDISAPAWPRCWARAAPSPPPRSSWAPPWWP